MVGPSGWVSGVEVRCVLDVDPFGQVAHRLAGHLLVRQDVIVEAAMQERQGDGRGDAEAGFELVPGSVCRRRWLRRRSARGNALHVAGQGRVGMGRVEYVP